MITEILSRKRSEHSDDHVDRALVKFIFTQGLSARIDQGEEGMIVLLVSAGRCAFLLSHTLGPLSSMLMYKFLLHVTALLDQEGSSLVHTAQITACLSRAGQKSLCVSLQHTNSSAHLSAAHTPGKRGQAFVDRGVCQSIILPHSPTCCYKMSTALTKCQPLIPAERDEKVQSISQ